MKPGSQSDSLQSAPSQAIPEVKAASVQTQPSDSDKEAWELWCAGLVNAQKAQQYLEDPKIRAKIPWRWQLHLSRPLNNELAQKLLPQDRSKSAIVSQIEGERKREDKQTSEDLDCVSAVREFLTWDRTKHKNLLNLLFLRIVVAAKLVKFLRNYPNFIPYVHSKPFFKEVLTKTDWMKLSVYNAQARETTSYFDDIELAPADPEIEDTQTTLIRKDTKGVSESYNLFFSMQYLKQLSSGKRQEDVIDACNS